MSDSKISIAFAGQPNSGKSTLFNMMTGARQHVANYPGITVEKKTGEYYAFERSVFITDLPGTYSLTSYSPEERVSRNFILLENPELIVNIADGSNLERHLYLTFQLLEMQCPLVMYLNKMDIAEHEGLAVDVDKLSSILGVPIIAGSAKKKEKIEDLKALIYQMSNSTEKQEAFQLTYGEDMEAYLDKIVEALKKSSKTPDYKIPLRWLAIKLCEGDAAVIEEQGVNFNNFEAILGLIEKLESEHKEKHRHSFEIEIALARASVAKDIINKAIVKTEPTAEVKARGNLKEKLAGIAGSTILFIVTFFIFDAFLKIVFKGFFANNAHFQIRYALDAIASAFFVAGAIFIYLRDSDTSINSTDRVDKVLCHRIYGLLILVELVLVFYWITVVLGYKMTDKVFPVFRFFRTIVSLLIPAEGLIDDGLIRGLCLNGIIDGAIMILNYLPIFFCLFALVAFLEDVGYMARLAFIMDRVLRKFGLHGQSTLPMILSGVIMGGCAVPGVMSTRTIRDNKSRLITILIIPLLNCMAKIPFYVLVTNIFFKRYDWLVLGFLSFFTLIVALIMARYFSLYVVAGEAEPFVLELPPYNLPTFRGVLIRTFERLWNFIKKVATTVVAVSIVIWAGITFPSLSNERLADYEAQKIVAIKGFANELNSSYSPYFASENGLLEYNRVVERLSLMKSLNFFGGEARDSENEYRLVLQNPEFAKIALRGSIDLGENIEAFKVYHEAFLNAKKDFTARYNSIDNFRKPILKAEFYNYWQKVNPFYFALVRTGDIKVKGTKIIDNEAKQANRQLRSINTTFKILGSDYHRERLEGSILGYLGKSIEPVTKYAGFTWKINIAILGSFAAKEALVSTLGTIYSVESTSEDSGKVLEDRIKDNETGMTPLDGLTIMLLIALFPPCIATMMATKTETKSWGWTSFCILYPVVLGSLIAVLVFQVGRLFGF